jgi:hypothetical protein
MIVEDFDGLPCCRVGKYLGSMLYIDFGKQFEAVGFRGQRVQAGEAVISIRDCLWRLILNGGLIVDSESITDENAEAMLMPLHGRQMLAISISDSLTLDFCFSERLILSLDLSNINEAEAEDEIAQIVGFGGKIYWVMPGGELILADKISVDRYGK